jgi:hypothetical protein
MPDEIDRHPIGLLMVQGGKNALAWSHGRLSRIEGIMLHTMNRGTLSREEKFTILPACPE